jgi:hypothetical protein
MVQFSVPVSILALFEGLTFPCTAEELIKYAEEHGVPEEFLAHLRAMPGHIFKSLDDLALCWGFQHEFQAAEDVGMDVIPTATDEDMLAPTKVPSETAAGDRL